MGVWKEVIKKIPTWRGITYGLYVASHWENISAEFEKYRQRVRDQKEWHEESEALLKEQHHRGMELVKADLQRVLKEKADIEQKAQETEGLVGWVTDLAVETINHLGVWAVLDPARWQIEKKSLGPEVSRLVEKVADRKKADLPPPPPPPVMPRGLMGSGREQYDPLAIELLHRAGMQTLSGPVKDSKKDK